MKQPFHPTLPGQLGGRKLECRGPGSVSEAPRRASHLQAEAGLLAHIGRVAEVGEPGGRLQHGRHGLDLHGPAPPRPLTVQAGLLVARDEHLGAVGLRAEPGEEVFVLREAGGGGGADPVPAVDQHVSGREGQLGGGGTMTEKLHTLPNSNIVFFGV